MARKSAKSTDIELLALQVRRLANELEGVSTRLKGVALSGEVIKYLLGELQAVRHLLDKKGEFSHLDLVAPTQEHAGEDRDS